MDDKRYVVRDPFCPSGSLPTTSPMSEAIRAPADHQLITDAHLGTSREISYAIPGQKNLPDEPRLNV